MRGILSWALVTGSAVLGVCFAQLVHAGCKPLVKTEVNSSPAARVLTGGEITTTTSADIDFCYGLNLSKNAQSTLTSKPGDDAGKMVYDMLTHTISEVVKTSDDLKFYAHKSGMKRIEFQVLEPNEKMDKDIDAAECPNNPGDICVRILAGSMVDSTKIKSFLVENKLIAPSPTKTVPLIGVQFGTPKGMSIKENDGGIFVADDGIKTVLSNASDGYKLDGDQLKSVDTK